MIEDVTQYRMVEAARLFGVSDDTVRRWVMSGRLPAYRDEAGRQVVEGRDLADLSVLLAAGRDNDPQFGKVGTTLSARNRATGLVTAIVTDRVMAQVDLQCGPYRFVSLMSREAVEELGLEVGDVATVVVKATNVMVEKGMRS